MAGKYTFFLALAVLGNSAALGGGYECMRSMGPQGLELALREYDETNAKFISAANEQEATALSAELERSRAAVDQVAGQRHATISRLFWYTDLEQAKAAAAESGKPILSLRLLGKLTDEYSCANSRYFRTALYANKAISEVLRERFVLHWQSVRPVPRVTIDFGDGRKLERTITGNSAHYVLTADGKPLDVLPGLYGPQEFLAWLERSEQLVQTYTTEQDEQTRASLVKKYHEERLTAIRENWRSDIEQVAPELLELGYGYDLQQVNTDGLVYMDALDVAHRALSKARPELPILVAINENPQKTDRMVTDKLWQRLAELHRRHTHLDDQSIELIGRNSPNPFDAGALSAAKRAVEDPLLRLVSSFEDSLALDTVRNEYLLHREIHNWYARGDATGDVDSLNERVYSELFLTPSSDPWLGLAPPDVYTALDNGGLVSESR